jgi:hypothetical protein
MLAQVLITPGLFISLLGASGIFWLYAKDILDLVTGKQSSVSAPWAELAIAAVILAIILPTSIVIYNGQRWQSVVDLLKSGANIRISDLPAAKRSDGSYYFQIRLNNTGSLPGKDWDLIFSTKNTTHILSANEEDKLFSDATEHQLGVILGFGQFLAESFPKFLKEHRAKANVIGVLDMVNHNQSITSEQIKEIDDKKSFLYNFVLLRYTDDAAEKEGIHYFASHCSRYDAAIRGFVQCASHNFEKKVAE